MNFRAKFLSEKTFFFPPKVWTKIYIRRVVLISKQKPNMPKPVKYKLSTLVFADEAPVLHKPRWKELYDYGIETGAMDPEYEKIKDPALGEEMLRRMRFERDEWRS